MKNVAHNFMLKTLGLEDAEYYLVDRAIGGGWDYFPESKSMSELFEMGGFWKCYARGWGRSGKEWVQYKKEGEVLWNNYLKYLCDSGNYYDFLRSFSPPSTLV